MLWNLEYIVANYKPLTKEEQLKEDLKSVMAVANASLITDVERVRELARIIKRLPSTSWGVEKNKNMLQRVCLGSSYVRVIGPVREGYMIFWYAPNSDLKKWFYLKTCLVLKQLRYFALNGDKFKPPGPEFFGYDS